MAEPPTGRLPASYYTPLPQTAYAMSPPAGWHAWIPGFRSAIWWKAAIATLFYLFCVIGIVVGLAELNLSITAFYVAALAIPVLAIQLVRFRRARPINGILALSLVLAFGMCGVSMATLPPSPRTSTALAPLRTPSPEQPPIKVESPSPATTAFPTPSPSPTLAPSSTPVVVVHSPTPRASPRPSPPPPPPPPSLCGAPPNPWNYNLCGGALIPNPPSSFCSYFPCIPSFWTSTNGYVELCSDGKYSHSGGVSGSCSHHGGNRQPLYT